MNYWSCEVLDLVDVKLNTEMLTIIRQDGEDEAT